MKLYSAEICLKGSLLNTVFKSGLSAAEVIMLRAEHGADGVRKIKPDGTSKMNYDKLVEHLCRTYGVKKFEKQFPGNRPQLPSDLKSAGVEFEDEDEKPAKTTGSKGRQTEKQKEKLRAMGIPTDDDEGDEDDDMDAAA